MESRGKGTVTSLSSLFSAEKAQKAAQCVKDNITEKYMLDNLHSFVNDNTNLINLVNRLPDELHHQIMVPFGKAAFFPGRLVHTNEFMVLLGEGYFAERSAKQAADILKRRGNMLDSEVDSLKSVIKDLKTEASFFDKTAEEAAIVLHSEQFNAPSTSGELGEAKSNNLGRDLECGSIAEKQPHLHLHCKQLILPNISAALENVSSDNEYDFSKLENLNFVAPLPSHMQKSWNLLNSLAHHQGY